MWFNFKWNSFFKKSKSVEWIMEIKVNKARKKEIGTRRSNRAQYSRRMAPYQSDASLVSICVHIMTITTTVWSHSFQNSDHQQTTTSTWLATTSSSPTLYSSASFKAASESKLLHKPHIDVEGPPKADCKMAFPFWGWWLFQAWGSYCTCIFFLATDYHFKPHLHLVSRSRTAVTSLHPLCWFLSFN